MDDPPTSHVALQHLRVKLQNIYESISNYQPSTDKPPILDSSLDTSSDEDGQWLQQDNVQGLKKLKDSVKIDLDVLEKFLDDPQSVHLPPLSTNAPYLIAVWNEVLCAPLPVNAVFKSFPLSGPSADTRQRGAQRSPATKVDVVADNGKRWIRVNTVKNSRMLAEFREIDSYLTDSDDSSYEKMEGAKPTLAQSEFDNSILRMGRSLVVAAKANPLEGTGETPQVTLRLTRLDPSPALEKDGDPRIAKTLDLLREMDINVELGEREEAGLPQVPTSKSRSSPPSPPLPLIPSIHINLDLSVLIALISDLTHAPLPKSIGEANKRFIPPQSYREWKVKKNGMYAKTNSKSKSQSTLMPDRVNSGVASDILKSKNQPTSPTFDKVDLDVTSDIPSDFAKHSRALTNQLLQEMGKGLLQEIHEKISLYPSETPVRFWTTPEARDRCLRIITKIGGVSEKRRAHALFWTVSTLLDKVLSLEEAEDLYWLDSRYPSKFVALFPIHLHPSSFRPDISRLSNVQSSTRIPRFFRALGQTCIDILSQETIPHPRALPEELVARKDIGEIQRAIVTKANPRLTAHTVQSLLWGAELGWTTLTANKTSVKAIMREMKATRVSRKLDGPASDGGTVEDSSEKSRRAAIWIVDPRSLAEGMSNLSR
ncbi:hypothetical protein E4T56_gene10197 [Termitomyces sp. T112]|nr:hypothetical protein E4T56_gene10197 [Termitomyces sp. T112]KAH0578432.1 hypothetical protein H2248_003580 [Termitomyces sp. 'cryptogamus']